MRVNVPRCPAPHLAALGTASALGAIETAQGPFMLPAGTIQFPLAPGQLRQPLWGHYANKTVKQLNRVLEGPARAPFDRTAHKKGHV